jgi:hypothetical protein
MTKQTLKRCAAATAVAVVLSVPTASFADPYWGAGPAIGAGIAGFALGTAAAAAASPYYGDYGYAPGPVVVAPGPYYGYAPGPAVVAPSPYYDYAPGPVVVAPGTDYDYAPGPAVVVPGPYYDVGPYFGGYYYGWRRPGQCRFSIRGC